MIPLVCSDFENEIVSATINAAAERVFAAKGQSISYKIGCMLEVPRALLRAESISKGIQCYYTLFRYCYQH